MEIWVCIVLIDCLLTVAASEIQHVYHVAISRMVFSAWHSVTQTAQKTREYFEVGTWVVLRI